MSETSNPPFRNSPSHFWNSALPLYNASGEMVGAIEVIRDITAINQAHEELKAREEWIKRELLPRRSAQRQIGGIIIFSELITQRKRAEEELEEAHFIINTSPAVAFLWKNQEDWPVEGELRVGATFFIYLPAIQKGELRPKADRKILSAAGSSILVMDDEDFICEVSSQMLQKMGFMVTTVPNSEESIRLYRKAFEAKRPFDAVILDLTIPGGMGGKATIKKLLEIDANVKAIVSSGYSNDTGLSNYARYGFCQAVGKPYRIEELRNALHAVLNTSDLDT